MLINYYKGEPNMYVLCQRNGELVQHGAGINFFGSTRKPVGRFQ